VFIRPAKREDALEVARVHVRSWQAAYRGLLPDDYLDALRPEERAQRYDFAGDDPAAPATVVALEKNTSIGFATVGSARGSDVANCGELRALYVADYFGRGVGSTLLTAACARLLEQGSRDVVLWVLVGNASAQHFYERHGWAPDGHGRKVTRWGVAVDEVRYPPRHHRPLITIVQPRPAEPQVPGDPPGARRTRIKTLDKVRAAALSVARRDSFPEVRRRSGRGETRAPVRS
jgi:GNAT superfamily N-acetyltransferase